MSKKPITSEAVAEAVEEIIDDIVEEIVDEILEETAPEPEVVASPDVHIAVDGDTFASIAALHRPTNMSKHEYATHLLELNKGKKISAGTVIRL